MMITQSHLVPGKQIQALHFPELISGDVLQKDEMRLMQHRKAQRVCLRGVHKEGGADSLTLFVVTQFLVLSLMFSCIHICKFAAYSICTNPITPTNVHTHSHPHTQTYTL